VWCGKALKLDFIYLCFCPVFSSHPWGIKNVLIFSNTMSIFFNFNFKKCPCIAEHLEKKEIPTFSYPSPPPGGNSSISI
jgi:hypothetical protein